MNSTTAILKKDYASERMLPMGQVMRRYSVSDRTIDRWLSSGILPEPLRINRYRYWRESDLERFERERMSPRRKPDTDQDTAA